VLEVASGTGEHAVYFAGALPALHWQPSDLDPVARASITAWCAGVANASEPLVLDVTGDSWPIARADAIVCINMVHIAPWTACEGLMPGGILYLYGPYRVGGAHTAPSNAAFDDGLRAENATWGVRDLEAVVACAGARGLRFVERVSMPANNLSLVLRRT
jgi:hypothetical protein